jgi:hypothetical protein
VKSKEEIEKWIRDEISNPIIGKLITDMLEKGLPYEDVMEMARVLIENTPNVEKQMVESQLRIQDGEQILSTLTNEKINKEIQYFQRKAEKYGFETAWCISEIRVLSLKSPFKAKWMTNGLDNNIKINLPNHKLSGLELWKYANDLYKLLGDSEHRFIEGFELIDDTIEVSFGS